MKHGFSQQQPTRLNVFLSQSMFTEPGNTTKVTFFFNSQRVSFLMSLLVQTLIIPFIIVCNFPLESMNFLRQGLGLKQLWIWLYMSKRWPLYIGPMLSISSLQLRPIKNLPMLNSSFYPFNGFTYSSSKHIPSH